jgi:hypothetical protein
VSRLPGIAELNEYIETLQAVIRLEDDFQDAWSRIPSIDELNERIDAMKAITQLA